ncbi:BspA family leucine-rich repeat surface protein [Billgrantia aerodenitrificans]|nr:BspA family leucine-rich repeat surface protein [Halomonas aerodenitrificans]
MKIKRMLVMIGLVGFVGASSYAMAQSYVYRSHAHGVKASGVINDIANENESEPEAPPVISNITTPSSFLFSENNDELSGNVGDVGTVTIYNELGNSILGQTVSLENGDFSSLLSPVPVGGDVLYVEVTDEIETLASSITVPELPEPVVACYDPSSVGQIGTESACDGMLIVDRTMLNVAIRNNNYTINHNDINYTLGYSEHNVFTGQVTDMSELFRGRIFENGGPDIGYWDTSNVTNMRDMFSGTFNQDISGWDVSNVENMELMFNGSIFFNQDISGWDTSNVRSMTGMFSNARTFNQYLSGWCVSLISSEPNSFSSTTLSWEKNDRMPVWGTCPRGEDQL